MVSIQPIWKICSSKWKKETNDVDKKSKKRFETTIQKTLDGMLRGLFCVQRIFSLNAAPFSWAEVGPRSQIKISFLESSHGWDEKNEL